MDLSVHTGGYNRVRLLTETVTTSVYIMSVDARERLIESTRELLWERGFAASSPRVILDRAHVGQGSMYHHFRGKSQLALAAIERNAEEMRAQVAAELARPGTAVERIGCYLRRERDVLNGCRFGKLAKDPDVADSPELQGAVRDMFGWLREQLTSVFAQGQLAGELSGSLNPEQLAAATVATLQGGYVLARATQDVAAFDAAIDGVLNLLTLHGPNA